MKSEVSEKETTEANSIPVQMINKTESQFFEKLII